MALVSSCLGVGELAVVLQPTESVLLFLAQSLDLQAEQVLLDACRPSGAARLLELLELLVILVHVSVP